MKTFSLSILVLISASACLQGQDFGTESNQFKPRDDNKSSYYAKPKAITVRANHMLAKAASNRSEFAKIPVGSLIRPVVVPQDLAPIGSKNLRKPILRTSDPMQNRKQEATLVSMNQPIEPQQFGSGSRQGVEIQAPPAAQEIIQDVGRPSPQNSSGFGNSAQDVSQGVEIGPVIEFSEDPNFEALPVAAPPQDETRSRSWSEVEQYPLSQQETFSTPNQYTEPLSANDVFQRVETMEPRTSQLRHVSDYFSPGGEPFAERTHQYGNPNFFGVDRRASCDPWANVATCGGLKANPGHLGLPWLKSKDNCDQTTRLRFKDLIGKSPRACDCQPGGPLGP